MLHEWQRKVIFILEHFIHAIDATIWRHRTRMTSTSHDVISTPLFYRKVNIHSHARLHYNIFTSTRRIPQLSTVHNYRHLYIYCPGYRERHLFWFLLFFYAPDLKGPLGASINRIVRLFAYNSVPLTNKVQYLKFRWWCSNQTWTVCSFMGSSHFTDITCPWG